MAEAQRNDMTAEETSNIQNLDEDIRPFSDIKTRVEDVVDTVVRRLFSTKQYEARTMQNLVNQASEEIIKQCQEEISPNYKYLATLICLQKGESGLHMGASCFWEAKHDGNFNKKYDFEDFYIVSNFFGITRNWAR